MKTLQIFFIFLMAGSLNAQNFLNCKDDPNFKLLQDALNEQQKQPSVGNSSTRGFSMATVIPAEGPAQIHSPLKIRMNAVKKTFGGTQEESVSSFFRADKSSLTD